MYLVLLVSIYYEPTLPMYLLPTVHLHIFPFYLVILWPLVSLVFPIYLSPDNKEYETLLPMWEEGRS